MIVEAGDGGSDDFGVALEAEALFAVDEPFSYQAIQVKTNRHAGVVPAVAGSG